MAPVAEVQGLGRARDPWVPEVHHVVARREETGDVVTISLLPERPADPRGRYGQFNMLTAFGVGEAAISVSNEPAAPGPIEHTVRDVGPVTHALCTAAVGDPVGVRGPFGTDWGVEAFGADRGIEADLVAATSDVVVVAGGIGLAPLRGAVRHLLGWQDGRGRRLWVLVGARSPDQVVFADELRAWRDAGARVEVTVDCAGGDWEGTVGVVTSLIPPIALDPDHTLALICGPEIMMRFSAQALVARGVPADGIRVSLERNMRCGIALCGHCQLGPLLLCRDGPIVTFDRVAKELLRERRR